MLRPCEPLLVYSPRRLNFVKRATEQLQRQTSGTSTQSADTRRDVCKVTQGHGQEVMCMAIVLSDSVREAVHENLSVKSVESVFKCLKKWERGVHLQDPRYAQQVQPPPKAQSSTFLIHFLAPILVPLAMLSGVLFLFRTIWSSEMMLPFSVRCTTAHVRHSQWPSVLFQASSIHFL